MYFAVLAMTALMAGTACVVVLFARNPHAEWYRAAAFAFCLLQAALLFFLAVSGRTVEDMLGR